MVQENMKAFGTMAEKVAQRISELKARKPNQKLREL